MRPLSLAREVLGERVEHHVAPSPVDLDQGANVSLPGAGVEVRADEVLRDRRRAEVGSLLADVHPLQHRRRGRRPAQAHTRREDLRERARVDHELASVQCVQRGQGTAFVTKQSVGVVLEDQELSLTGDADELSSPLERHGDSGGIVEVRHRVDELRAPPRSLELVEDSL